VNMNKVYFGDCRGSMQQMAVDGVKAQMCVTSPPYFGLRDYGHPGQLGLESTPDEYVANMVEVFRYVRDVLADDGVLWLNLGDSYARSSAKGGSGPGGKNIAYSDAYGVAQVSRIGSSDGAVGRADRPGTRSAMGGLDAKQMLGIPWRVAFALQADGWYLRQDIIWHKPNPMPESVTDRCTKAHEYIFMLTKRERYYYDNDAIKEPAIYAGITGMDESGFKNPANFNGKHAKTDKQRGHSHRPAGFNERWDAMSKEEQCAGMRNKRSVWTVATKPYSGAHFATFPPALIEPCILATSRPGDLVLDPFFGSGTTGAVCNALGRKWIGCELNREYESLQLERTAQEGFAMMLDTRTAL
jgi:DNA modification methylase